MLPLPRAGPRLLTLACRACLSPRPTSVSDAPSGRYGAHLKHVSQRGLAPLRGTDSDIFYFFKIKKKKKKTVKPEPLNWSVSMFPTLWNGCGPVWGSPVAWPCLSPKVRGWGGGQGDRQLLFCFPRCEWTFSMASWYPCARRGWFAGPGHLGGSSASRSAGGTGALGVLREGGGGK